MTPRVLVIGGSDPLGGAGLQADIKTVTALGGYASSVVTAVTVQDRRGVGRVIPMDAAGVSEQMSAALGEVGADVVKTGMLATATIVSQVVKQAASARVPLVVDPVLEAGSGGSLLSNEGRELLAAELLPVASLLTPNAPEARALCGVAVGSEAAMGQAADRLLAMGAAAVLIKGGHLEGDEVVDLLRTADGIEQRFVSSRIDGAFHGTGCTLASAIAVGIGEGLRLVDAIERARAYLQRAMEGAHRFGKGQRLLDHGGAGVAASPDKDGAAIASKD